MINFFLTWLPGVLSYCQIVSEDEPLRLAWIDGDFTKTSVYYPGEFFEQVFGDLDSGLMRQQMPGLIARPDLVESINEFLDALRDLEKWIYDTFDLASWAKGEPHPHIAQEILSSSIWKKLREAAVRALELSNVY